MLPLGLAATLALSTATPTVAAEEPEPSPGSAAEAEADLSDVRVELAGLRTELEEARERASGLIEDYLTEQERLEAASERRESAEEQAEAATERTEETRVAAARQAAAAYKGSDLSSLHAWTGPRGPAEALERGAYLNLLGEHQSDELDRAEAARVASETLASAASSAETAQEEAAEEADRAREQAEEAVAEQEERTQELMAEQSSLEERLPHEAGPGAAREGALRDARDAQGSGGGNVSQVSDDDSACEPAEAADHDNGQIPDAALCPLPQSGEKLRADAAEAFMELDGAFEERFGRALCVTDSYRPYHEQVRLFQEMAPGMAAQPGTSQHGLGVAVDLCGGVEQLGTVEHQWMLENAGNHDWENPEWARDGFEPWHWEYTG
ncbi:D-alanyl-D-alanine carboxypeptidase family protein [Nocardiopsis sp. HNM0947]|uniref:D-alanyl-D-alanine carboxypeptidase family protein n=1 Tax=Nocardiopsis coralli TaxID=2772213 RepID=A0ABR9P0R6_9ACTN|nr:M15 family metallopeptidase [Nocardiopsis coralli]MBE2997436.1 D-alanyl-D-alanine carboxypeptidase family protein [Nocardiopsis coralli]